jgi:hypothetical protein
MAESWSREEVELTVPSYVDMLAAELRRDPFARQSTAVASCPA